MVVQTAEKSMKRLKTVQPFRRHDYLYDLVYTLSGERDHARDMFNDHANIEYIKCVPIFETMFSDLGRYQRFQTTFDPVDRVPAFVPRNFRSAEYLAKEALRPRLKITEEAFAVLDKGHGFASKQGLFHYVPCTGFDERITYNTAKTCKGDGTKFGDHSAMSDGKTRSIKTQTDYRDGEVQTDPCSLSHAVPLGADPRLLKLASLTYGNGLPATIHDVEFIEHVLKRRDIESSLPPITDIENRGYRYKVLAHMETCYWYYREKEIARIKDLQLSAVLEWRRMHEIDRERDKAEYLNKIMENKQKEDMEKERTKTRLRVNRAIRILMRTRQMAIEPKAKRRDLVREYGDLGSQIFAPLTRIGSFTERCQQKYKISSHYINSYQGLLELEKSMPVCLLKMCCVPPATKCWTKDGYMTRKCRYDKDLEDMYEYLSDKRKNPDRRQKPSRLKERRPRMLPRPDTPSADPLNQSRHKHSNLIEEIRSSSNFLIDDRDLCQALENQEHAITLLQSWIRGRGIQNDMYEARTKHLDLLREVRSTHALWSDGQGVIETQKETILDEQGRRKLQQHKDTRVEEILAHMDGETLGNALDFFSKELIRLQEEQRLHAMSMLVERQRRIREAEESGTRQVEERRRREADDMFKQLMKVDQDSVDTYLEDIILVSTERTADHQARREIQQLALKIDRFVHETQQRPTLTDAETIVSELVYSFLIPEVQKQEFRCKIRNQQHRFLTAAHHEVYQTTTDDIFDDDTLIDKTKDFVSPLAPVSAQDAIDPEELDSPNDDNQ